MVLKRQIASYADIHIWAIIYQQLQTVILKILNKYFVILIIVRMPQLRANSDTLLRTLFKK